MKKVSGGDAVSPFAHLLKRRCRPLAGIRKFSANESANRSAAGTLVPMQDGRFGDVALCEEVGVLVREGPSLPLEWVPAVDCDACSVLI